MYSNSGRSGCDHLALKSTKYSATKYLMLEDPSLMFSILLRNVTSLCQGLSSLAMGGGQERETLGTRLICGLTEQGCGPIQAIKPCFEARTEQDQARQ